MKRTITLALAIIMALSLFVTPALADNVTTDPQDPPVTEPADPTNPDPVDNPDDPTIPPSPSDDPAPTDDPTPTDDPEPTDEPKPTDEPEPSPDPVPLTGISIEETELKMKAGETYTVQVKFEPEDANEIPDAVWKSSNESVATVDKDGKITAVALGDAVITVQYGEFTNQCKVNVRFADVPDGSYYYDAVYWALDKKVTHGTTPQTFSPEDGCTRAQAVTFLWRINGSPANNTTIPFGDVPASAYYAAAVRWAYQTGIVNGTSASTFSPDKTCTRAEIISMIWRCRRPSAPQNAATFGDAPVGTYYYLPVKWATSAGVTNGTTPWTFSPDLVCTRGQIVTMLHRCDAGGYAIYNATAAVPYPNAALVLDKVGWDLKAAFDWSARLTYYHDNIDISAGPLTLSNYGFTYLKGDCYVYAATFYTMAIDLGYDAHMVWGYVPSSNGYRATHAWVEIDMNGTTYVFDPNFTYRTHRNGYMIHYGMSGTWMYVDYHRVN